MDILLVGYPGAIPDWDQDQDLDKLKTFLMDSTKIPTGAWDTWLSDMVLVTYANQAEEQGEWAAVYLNLSLAKSVGIRFPMDLIERSLSAGVRFSRSVLQNPEDIRLWRQSRYIRTGCTS